MAAPNLIQCIFLLLHSLLMTTEVISATVTLKPDNISLICTNPGYQYIRHPLDCSRWFHCSHEQPVEMPACVDTFSMISLTCLTKQNEKNDCISTCIFDGKLHYLGEIFVGRNSCEKCICQNNRGTVVCSSACLTKRATCSYNGRTYRVGQYFMYSDGCNTCLCEEQGIIRCTYINCQANKVTCYHQETIYVAGETFLHLDGQQTCTCRVDGIVSCSFSHVEQTEDETSCLYDEKWRRAGAVFPSVDHCNQCECLDGGHVTCTTFNCSSPRPLLYEQKDHVTCIYDKKEYGRRESFFLLDGCTYCRCDQYGQKQVSKRNSFILSSSKHIKSKLKEKQLSLDKNTGMISQYSPSEQFQHLPRVTSTASENIILFFSNNSLSTKVANINISKLIATDDSGLVAESNMQNSKHSLLSSLFTAETPLTPNQNVTLKKSTGNSLLESNTRHSTYRAFSVSASQKTTSKKTSSPSTSAPSTQLQNIFIQNATLFWNLDLQNMTLELASLLARTQNKSKFLSSESEIPLSNIIPFPLVNISQGAKNPASRKVEYFKFIGTDTPKFERSKLPEVSTFATPKVISLAATFKSDMNSKKELKNVETNLNSTDNLELTDDSIPKISTTSAYSASSKTQLASQTTQNVSGDFITFPGIPVISSNESLHSERNMFENASLSTNTTTNFISTFSHTNNSISKNISKPSLLITKTNKRASDITTQPESIFLSTLINTPRTISALAETEAKSLFTLSPSATMPTPAGTTVISHSKTPNTLSRYWIATFNKYAINKISVSESSTQSSSITAQDDMLSGSMKTFTQSSSATKDPNPKSPTSLYSDLGSSTASSFISSAETSTSTSNSVHFTDSNVPQTMRVLIATSKTGNISVQPNPFISNNLTTTPSFFVGSPTSVSINKTTAANSFNISTNSAILSSASETVAPTKHISVSSLTFVNEDILITPTINDTNTFRTGKQPQPTPSIITTETILNPYISYTVSEPIKHYINPSTAKSHLETNTPIYSIPKNNSLSSNTAMRSVFLIKPILATPITRTDKKPFVEQTVTNSQTLSKISSPNLKAMYIPTTTEEVSISSTTFSKSLKSFIAAPNIASTRPTPLTRPTSLTRTDSELMRIASRKSTPVPDSVSCDYNGRKYKIWEIFPSQDECNTCECLYDGMVHCSKFLCRDQKEGMLSAPIPTRIPYLATTTKNFPTTPTLDAIPCFYNGIRYKLWDVFSLDDCNTCDCLYHGFVHCTDRKCMAKNDIPVKSESVLIQKSETCIYNGQVYMVGHTFLSEDKCTICNCTFGASISCTDVHCPSENIHLNDRKSKLEDNILPMPKVSRSPSVTAVSTTTKIIPASLGSREVCWYNGLSYQSGDKFNSEDNCNTCTCMPDSLVTCTQLLCTSKNVLADQSTCAYNGHIYQNGQMFNSADGCNTCGCLDRIILCTSHVCRFGKNKFKVSVVTIAPVKCIYNGKTYHTGEVFNSTDNCNLCDCTKTGQVKCTQKTCRREPDMLQYDAPANVPVSITCSFDGRPYKPRQIFQMADGCSMCTCTDDGRIICTNKKCFINNNKTKERQNSEAVFTTTATPSTFCIYEEQTFQAGDIFNTIDGCNSCNCTLDGEVKCTQRRCPLNIAGQLHVDEDPLSVHVGATCIYEEQVYKPQQLFPSSDGCNTCRCSDAGRVHCTNTLCPAKSNQSKRKALLASKISSTAKAPILERCSYNRQTYKVGDTFYSVDDCNMCNCSHNGVVKCSQKSCLPHNKTLKDETSGSCIFGGKAYSVGDTFDLADGCNICGCSYNEKILCTNRTCYQGIVQNRESSYMATTPTPQLARPKKTICHYNGHFYISGRIFKAADNCNMCGCLKNGVVHCTKNICNFKMVQTTVPSRTAAIPKNIPLVQCRYFGKKYNVGQMFAVQNGCNMCACLAEGIVRCTKQRCDPPVVICKHDGNVYFIGQTFADECNTCKCGSHGVITCTELHCGTEDDGRCQYNGQEQEQGDTFRSSDGCHLCTCYSNARISCRPAPCQVAQNHFDTSRERSEEEYLDD